MASHQDTANVRTGLELRNSCLSPFLCSLEYQFGLSQSMKRSSSQMNVPVLLKHVCGDSRIVVLLAVSVVLCFFSVVFMTKALVLSPQQVDFEHIQFHS